MLTKVSGYSNSIEKALKTIESETFSTSDNGLHQTPNPFLSDSVFSCRSVSL